MNGWRTGKRDFGSVSAWKEGYAAISYAASVGLELEESMCEGIKNVNEGVLTDVLLGLTKSKPIAHFGSQVEQNTAVAAVPLPIAYRYRFDGKSVLDA